MPLQIYEPKANAAALATNGIGSILCSSAVVHEEINGEFSISITVPQSSPYFDHVVGGAIVKATTPRGDQYFRLTRPITTLTGGKQVYGWHISYDLHRDMIMDTNLVAKTGAEAVALILAAGISETRFTGTSDISTLTNARLVRMSPLAALIGDTDNAFKNRWGGEIERDNFIVNMKSALGADNGVTIRYRKNLTGLILDEDYDQIANRIVPTGLTESDAPLLLPETYIDSARIDDTPVPCVKHIHYTDVKVGAVDADGNVVYEDEDAVYTELRARVGALYAAGADLPVVSAKIEFIDLSTTEEYKEYKTLETVNIGDTIHCYHEDLNIELEQRVVAYDYDVLTKKYINATLGILKPTLADSAYAQDIDLSALKGAMETVVKQGATYNNVYINHEDGFVAQAIIDGVEIEVRQNAQEGFSVYADNEYIGGVRIINGKAAMVGNVLTNNIDSNCWAEIGDISIDGGTWRGVLIYNKQYSTTSPLVRILTFNNGHVAIRRPSGSSGIEFWPDGTVTISGAEGTQRLFISADDDFGIQNNNGDYQSFLSDTNSYIKPSTGANHAVGADTSGPYYVKNNVKTYF